MGIMGMCLKKIGLLSVGIAMLAACQSTPETIEDTTSTPLIRAEVPVDANKDDSSFFLTPLDTSMLPKGRCGMVLWTLDANRPVPVLRYLSGENGEFRLDSVPYELVRIEASGSGAYGVFEEQVFAAGKDIRVYVTLSLAQGFENGNYLEEGLIRVVKPESPELVTPVAGIAGCRQ